MCDNPSTMTDGDDTTNEETSRTVESERAGARTVCLNCGEALSGPYCSACGQKVRELNPSLRGVLGDWVEQVTVFDSKILRTLVPLITRPGQLSLEYFAGRRARYVAPLKLYLLLSFLMFLTAGVTNQSMVVFKYNPSQSESPAAADSTSSPDDSGAAPQARPEAGLQEEGRDLVVAPIRVDGGAGSGEPAWAQRISRALDELASDPQAMSERAIAQLPKAAFLLVPVFALMLRVLYRRGPHRYVRYLVLSFHIHSAVALLVTMAMVLMHFTGIEAIPSVMQLVMIGYLFLALRRVHRQGAITTLVKMSLLLFGYVIALSLAMAATFSVLLLPHLM